MGSVDRKRDFFGNFWRITGGFFEGIPFHFGSVKKSSEKQNNPHFSPKNSPKLLKNGFLRLKKENPKRQVVILFSKPQESG